MGNLTVMEVTLTAESIAILGICVVILIAVVSGFVAQVRYTSKLPTREELYATRDELRNDMNLMREEFRRDMAAMREEFQREMAAMRDEFRQDIMVMREEQRQDMAAMRQEFRQDMTIMREEQRQDMAMLRDGLLGAIRDSEARIVKAIVNHRHPQPDGPPIFVEPV